MWERLILESESPYDGSELHNIIALLHIFLVNIFRKIIISCNIGKELYWTDLHLFICCIQNKNNICHSNSGNQAPRNPASSKSKKAVSFSLPPLSSASSSSGFGYASTGSQRQRLIFKLMGIHSPDGKF